MANTAANLDKCPACGGVLIWDAEVAKIRCSYCGKGFRQEELTYNLSPDTDGGEEGYDEYRCGDCGGTIVTDSGSITSRCPYCGNTAILKNRIAGKYHPDYIIPFRITPEQAKDEFIKTLNRKMVRRSFQKKLEVEDVTSLFVPFWLYSTEISAEITFEEIRRDKKGNAKSYRKTARFTESYDKVPVDASLHLEDDKMDSIEPYDYAELKSFHPAYFIGHKAERYDTDVRLMSQRAKKKIEKAARTSFSRYLYDHPDTADGAMLRAMGKTAEQAASKVVRGTLKTMNIDADDVNVDFDSEFAADNANIGRIKKSKVKADMSDYRYALFPVYLIRGNYRGKNHLYHVNGQTGRVAADFPFSYLQYYLNRIVGTLAGSLLVGSIFWLGARIFIKLWEQNNDAWTGGPSVSGARLFLIVWAATFLFLNFLETKHNGKQSLREARARTGEIAIVQNAKNFRVPGSFQIADER